MSWEDIIKAGWKERGDKYSHYKNRDKPYEERETGKPYHAIIGEEDINNWAKDNNLPKGNYDLNDEYAIEVELVLKNNTLEFEYTFNNLDIVEQNTDSVMATLEESDFEIATDDVEIKLGDNFFDFEIDGYRDGKFYAFIYRDD